jgi:hypothetical protein
VRRRGQPRQRQASIGREIRTVAARYLAPRQRIEPRLRLSEIERVARKPTENLGAYDLYLRALAQMYRYTEESLGEAVARLRQALAIPIGPNFAAPMALHERLGVRRLIGRSAWRQTMPVEDAYRKPMLRDLNRRRSVSAYQPAPCRA